MSNSRPTSGAALCIYDAPEYVSALLAHLLDEYTRVYWNVFQEECPLTSGAGLYGPGRNDGSVLHVPGLVARSYWWGDEQDARALEANWEFGGAAFTWYKHPGRGLETNVNWDPEQWVTWFDACVAAIQVADVWPSRPQGRP